MCVIVAKKPGVEIPYEMLSAACQHNRDGWGMAVADRGQLEIRREYSNKGNDAVELAKLLENVKDVPLMLHLRYATAGGKSEANCHPFPVLTKATHGMDLVFAHNGTLSDFSDKNSNFSDSWHFNEEIVRPLVIRCGLVTENVLNDQLLKAVLKQYAGSYSIFTLMNGDGEYLVVNDDRGVKYPFGWASNSYSFSQPYGLPKGQNSIYSSTFTPKKDAKKKKAPLLQLPPPVFKGDKNTQEFTLANKEALAGAAYFRNKLDAMDKTKPTFIPGFEQRETFAEIMGLKTLDDLQFLSMDDMLEMARKHPRLCALAMLDLLTERLEDYHE